MEEGLDRQGNPIEKRGARLVERWRQETGGGALKTAEETTSLLEWLAGLRSGITAVSRRQYKCCVMRWLLREGHMEAAKELAEIGSQGCRRRSRRGDPNNEEAPARTSALKRKNLPDTKSRERLYRLLRLGRGCSAEVADWLEVGQLTGLRPVEWYGTKYRERTTEPGKRGTPYAQCT